MKKQVNTDIEMIPCCHDTTVMTMRAETGKIKIFMAGLGTFTIDWGDGFAKETHTLLVNDKDFTDDDKRDKFGFRHNYSDASLHTVTIIGVNITHLTCSGNQLVSLDVSKNTALTMLACADNQLASLNISNNIALTGLVCADNQLSSLDVSKNTALTGLVCWNNQLSSLDVNKNIALTWLDCSDNYLKNIDVSKNIALTCLDCSKNQLTCLDVNENIALTILRCGKNQLSNLKVSQNVKLLELQCYDNRLANIDVSNNTALIDFLCFDNQLSNLDVSNNTALYRLECQNNQLINLDVSACTSLKRLSCHANQLASLEDNIACLLVRIRDIRTIEVENNKYAIVFPMYRFYQGGMYEIYLVKDGDKIFLTDEGSTYAELDKVFEMTEPDVIKNLVAIMKQYEIRKHPLSNAFTLECTPQNVHFKLSYFIQALSFMLNMRIFYI